MAKLPIDHESPVGHARCPICRRPSDPVLRPFCSKRCADVDLHRWLSGAYAVPAEETEDDEAAVDDSGEPEAKKS